MSRTNKTDNFLKIKDLMRVINEAHLVKHPSVNDELVLHFYPYKPDRFVNKKTFNRVWNEAFEEKYESPHFDIRLGVGNDYHLSKMQVYNMPIFLNEVYVTNISFRDENNIYAEALIPHNTDIKEFIKVVDEFVWNCPKCKCKIDALEKDLNDLSNNLSEQGIDVENYDKVVKFMNQNEFPTKSRQSIHDMKNELDQLKRDYNAKLAELDKNIIGFERIFNRLAIIQNNICADTFDDLIEYINNFNNELTKDNNRHVKADILCDYDDFSTWMANVVNN